MPHKKTESDQSLKSCKDGERNWVEELNWEKVPAVEEIDGKTVYNIGADLASVDPFVYGRLIKARKLR